MCGIIGYIGQKQAVPLLLNGLRSLEYRGYDSCGMAILNSKISVRKSIGKVDEADKKLNFESMNGSVGIAHTRWSTHGGVTNANAHPHLSCDESVAVVYNG